MAKIQNVKIILLACLFFTSIFMLETTAYAKEDQGIGFQIQPIFNSNQVEDDLGYYYINAKPNEDQTLELLVTSTEDEDIKINALIENAISTNHGKLDYSSNLKKVDDSLKDPLSEIISVEPKTFDLKAKESRKIQMKLKTPSENFNGIKMGRVVVKKEENKKEKKAPISNQYQYGVGIIVTEEVDAFNNGNSLKLNSVGPKVENAFRVVSADISAPTPKTIEGLKVRAYVTEKGKNKKIKERNIDNFMFAPNSKVSFQIPWGTDNFKPGDYTFHFDAKNNASSFNIKQNFKIAGNQAKSLNNDAAFSVQTSQRDKILLIIINTILVITMIYVLRRDSKWVKNLKSIKSSKKKKKTKHKQANRKKKKSKKNN